MSVVPETNRVVVVGASLAGLRVVENIRRIGYDGEVVLVGDETHLPYDRPPLSKKILLGEATVDDIVLRNQPWEELNVTLRLGVRASGFDGKTRTVTLADGTSVQGDKVFICTGARARSMPNVAPRPGIHTLRTLEDAQAIGALLKENAHIVVVGGGFIGAEVAAVAKQLGVNVTLVEPMPTLMVRGIGERWGRFMEAYHRHKGVDVRTGVGIAAVEGDDALQAVVLTDGTRIETTLMVVGIGADPNVEWLEDSGVELGNGVITDAYGESSVPNVYAVGDVARFYHEGYGEHLRVEHWTNAVEMARAVVQAAFSDEKAVFTTIPMVWSDQFDLKIQTAGRMLPDDEEVVTMGEEADGEFLVLRGREGKLTGAISFNRASMLVRMKMLMAKGTALADAVAMAQRMHKR